MNFDNIIKKFSQIMCEDDGICGFVSKRSSDYLKSRLCNIESMPITKVQFDQLLSLQNIKCVSDGFFRFYWLTRPDHFYKIEDIELDPNQASILSLDQLFWGFNRLFIDCLYVFGNIQKGFEELADKSYDDLLMVFEKYKVNTEQIKSRGNTLKFNIIKKTDI